MQNISCNLCGGSQTRLLFLAKDINYKTTTEEFRVARCRNCELVYVTPRPEESELSKFYSDEYRPYKTAYAEKAVYQEPQNPSRHVLDIGSGSGDFLAEIYKKNNTAALYGVDFDQRAVEAGKLRGFPIFYGSIFEANYPEAKFDEAHMSHFLEHAPDPLGTLKETARVLKSGGKLVITIPNFKSLSRMIFRKYWYHLDAPRHLYHFSPATLGSMLEKAGFKNMQFEFIPSPKYFLQSYAFWRYGGKKKFSPLLWKLLTFPAKVTSFFSLSSTMRVTAKR